MLAHYPTFSEGWNALHHRSYPGALRRLNRVLAELPKFYKALAWKAFVLLMVGRDDEAIAAANESGEW